jgi:hypothetical protein
MQDQLAIAEIDKTTARKTESNQLFDDEYSCTHVLTSQRDLSSLIYVVQEGF